MTLFPNAILTAALVFAPAAATCLAADVERGRYLAEEVAQCQLCHTPAAENGELDKSRWMKGAVLNIQPIQPVANWHKTAPDLTPDGRLWKTWTEAGLLKYLQTGLTPKGTKAGPPMPTYKLSPQDARAIVDYLKTLEAKE